MAPRKGKGETRAGKAPPRDGPPPGAVRQASAYAAIDLGSSNCRMLLAKPSHRGFNVVGSFSRIVRLAEGLSDHGRLGDAAMGRTIDALKVCAGKIGRWKAPRIHAVATEACRRATNNQAFTARVKAETGIVVETISPERESRLTVAGCAPLLNGGAPYALIFDIGGGSTELMWVETAPGKAPRLLDMLSIPFGVVALAERFGDDVISADDYARMMDIPDDALSAFDAKHDISRNIAEDKVRALGTSGTVTMLGGLYLDLPRYNRAKVDGLDMDTTGVLANAARLARMTCKERAAISCIGRARAELAVGGCAFLEAILRRWPFRKLRAADRGIREGLLLSMMSEDGALSTDAG